jgi:hypothetical protein
MYQLRQGIQPCLSAFVTSVCAPSDARVAARLHRKITGVFAWGKCPLSFLPVSAHFLVMVGQETSQHRAHGHDLPSTGERSLKRKLPVGAEVFPEGVHFRVWAPQSKKASVQLISPSETKDVPLES